MDTPFADWVGRTRKTEDVFDLARVRMMAATMAGRVAGIDDAALGHGDPLPAGWHWLWFNEARPAAELGADGHPEKGGFLPAIDLPRRMWAGGRITFHAPILVGEHGVRTSRIAAIEEKSGRSGRLCFVTLIHEIAVDGTPAVTEEQDLVYRAPPAADAVARKPAAAPAQAHNSFQIVPDPVWLFRYSALTFNGHRIHYDPDYARDVEGYRGLIVHGPLTATVLMRLAGHMGEGARLSEFSFRATGPLFVTEPFTIAGKLDDSGAEVWAADRDGRLAMRARARFA